MTGRRRKPIQKMIAEGDPSNLGKHRLEQKLSALPKGSGGLPACPAHLKGRAREVWNFWTDELILMQLDSRCDAQMLEGACVSYARAVQADLVIEKEGIVVHEPILVDGKPLKNLTRIKKHPAVTVSFSAWDEVRRFGSEFGLSPASRVRLAIVPAAQTGETIGALMSGPRLTEAQKQKLQ